jgi:hypothetical protein
MSDPELTIEEIDRRLKAINDQSFKLLADIETLADIERQLIKKRHELLKASGKNPFDDDDEVEDLPF